MKYYNERQYLEDLIDNKIKFRVNYKFSLIKPVWVSHSWNKKTFQIVQLKCVYLWNQYKKNELRRLQFQKQI